MSDESNVQPFTSDPHSGARVLHARVMELEAELDSAKLAEKAAALYFAIDQSEHTHCGWTDLSACDGCSCGKDRYSDAMEEWAQYRLTVV